MQLVAELGHKVGQISQSIRIGQIMDSVDKGLPTVAVACHPNVFRDSLVRQEHELLNKSMAVESDLLDDLERKPFFIKAEFRLDRLKVNPSFAKAFLEENSTQSVHLSKNVRMLTLSHVDRKSTRLNSSHSQI